MSAFKAIDGIDPRFGGEMSRVEGFSSDEYTVTIRFYPHADLKIPSNVDFEFFVSPALREKGGIKVFANDPSFQQYIPPEYLTADSSGNTIIDLPWMVKVRYSLSVWFFAVRSLLRKDQIEPWRASVLTESEFREFGDASGSGISGARNSSTSTQDLVNVSLVFGISRDRGRRPYMEDVEVLMQDLPVDSRTISVFGVLDGHGGQDCATFVSEEFPSTLAKLLRGGRSCADALFRAFQDVDEEYINHTYDSNAGSTANLALFDKYSRRLYVANTGDTRAVLSRNGTAMNLSFDRKASDAEEIARIVKAGGFVINNRVLGSLAVSRAFGDIPLKANRNVLLVDPEITSVDLGNTSTTSLVNNFIIIATDGLWDVMSSQAAVDFVKERLCAKGILETEPPHNNTWILPTKNLQEELSAIAEALIRCAIDELRSMDNVTVLIAFIQVDEVNFTKEFSNKDSSIFVRDGLSGYKQPSYEITKNTIDYNDSSASMVESTYRNTPYGSAGSSAASSSLAGPTYSNALPAFTSKYAAGSSTAAEDDNFLKIDFKTVSKKTDAIVDDDVFDFLKDSKNFS